jgi:SAM-dependent methyltransferase
MLDRAFPFPSDWEQGLPHRYITEFLASALDGETGKVLDVCCGKQPYRRLAPDAEVWFGLDWPAGGQAAPDVRGDALRLPFRDAVVDVVVCSEALEHLPDPFGALSELSRVLKPGGRALLTVPFAIGLHEAPRDFFRYTPYGLRELCRRSGLAVEQEARFGSVLSSLACTMMRHAGPAYRTLGRAKGPALWAVNRALYRIDALANRLPQRLDTLPLGYGVVARRLREESGPVARANT